MLNVTCSQCVKLAREQETRERLWAAAVGCLKASAEEYDTAKYLRLRAAAEEARLESELARLELARHGREDHAVQR